MAKLYTKQTWTDEVLTGEERYDILEDDDTPIYEDAQIVLSTAVVQAGSSVNASRMQHIEDGLDAVDSRLDTDATALDARLDTAESNITALDTRLDTAETDITTLETKVGSWTASGGNTLQDSTGSIVLDGNDGKAFVHKLELINSATPAYPASGRVRFFANSDGQLSKVDSLNMVTRYREVLTADRTYYVRTDGNNNNNGLTDSSGGAFLTIQKAVDVVSKLDINGYTVTIQVGNGTYTGAVNLKNVVGFEDIGNLIIQGDTTTPSNVVVSVTGNHCFSTSNLRVIWKIAGFKLTTTTSGACLRCEDGHFEFANCEFGSCAGSHIYVLNNGYIGCYGNYSISGSAINHWIAAQQGRIVCTGKTITLTGTPAFSAAFANGQYLSLQIVNGNTYSGSATGVRYSVIQNAVIYTNGATLPGSSAGTTGTGGQYS